MTSFPDPEQLENAALHALISFAGKSILEIGTGDGRTLAHYAHDAKSVVALDIDRYELEIARDHTLKGIKNLLLSEASAEQLPFANTSFDIVVFSWSLCCVAPAGAMRALQEGLRVSHGILLDIRTMMPPPEVWVRNRAGQNLPCGPVTRKNQTEHNEAANAAVARALDEGWLIVTASQQFDWVDVYETGDELVDEVTDEWENWYIGEDLSIRLARTLSDAGRGAVPFITQGVQAQVLKGAQKH